MTLVIKLCTAIFSDLEEVTHEPQRGGAKYSTTPGPGKSASKNSAGGEKVMALSRSIELQLSVSENKLTLTTSQLCTVCYTALLMRPQILQ